MHDSLRRRAKKLPFYASARSIYHRIQKRPRHPLQDLKTESGYKLRRLGSDYGGWTFVDDESLNGSTIISAGLGEDASFDTEFARLYKARVIIVDPTPRAQSHYEEIIANLGNPNSCGYSDGGKQPVGAYDLRDIDRSDLALVPKALWNSGTLLKFFEPTNADHVSHSIVNYQRGFTEEGAYIEVESTTMTDLLQDFNLPGDNALQLVKLDIEGAEVEVISHFLEHGVRPKQILVEFDELNAPSTRGYSRIDFINGKLQHCGYKCIWTDMAANFLYVPKELRP